MHSNSAVNSHALSTAEKKSRTSGYLMAQIAHLASVRTMHTITGTWSLGMNTHLSTRSHAQPKCFPSLELRTAAAHMQVAANGTKKHTECAQVRT